MASGHGYVEVGGGGEMDTSAPFHVAANALPEKCPACSFPDLDFVPQPYRLARKAARPVEIDTACLGNFLVRDRARAILEAVAPGQCRFYATALPGGPSPWSLAVPANLVSVADIDPKVTRCRACGEPKVAHMGIHFTYRLRGPVAFDVFRSREWHSYESTGEEANWYWMHVLKREEKPKAIRGRWTRVLLGRTPYMSLRLARLLKEAKVKGVGPAPDEKAGPTPADLAWVRESLGRLSALGLVAAPPSPAPPADPFRAYLEAHAGRKRAAPDFSRVEARLGRALPPSYKAFIAAVGPRTFRDVDGDEGFDARVLGPSKLDLATFRRGQLADDEESAAVDGIMFAATGHGDAFIFDLAAGREESPVLLFDHEGGCYEPYAEGFAECVLQWVAGGGAS